MQYLDSTYTLRFNTRYGYDGPLFRGRFANQIVGNRKYQKYLTAYIHLNPVKASLVKHPSEPCWTGHRVYMGLEEPRRWLTTGYLLELFGGSSEIDRFVMDVHRGVIKPLEHFSDDGWIDEKKSAEATASSGEVGLQMQTPIFTLPAVKPSRFEDPDKILQEVCELTRTKMSKLKTACRGRGANPARRFAAWALLQSTRCTCREVAELLEMSRHQASNLSCRLRKGTKNRDLMKWMSHWKSRKMRK